MFLVIEGVNRFRLGRMHWTEGESALETLRARIEGVTAVLTQAQFTEMRSNSKQILGGLRWGLDFVTILFLGSIFTILLASQGAVTTSLANVGGVEIVLRPALWLGSVYALLFVSETWLRFRGKMPKPTIE